MTKCKCGGKVRLSLGRTAGVYNAHLHLGLCWGCFWAPWTAYRWMHTGIEDFDIFLFSYYANQ